MWPCWKCDIRGRWVLRFQKPMPSQCRSLPMDHHVALSYGSYYCMLPHSLPWWHWTRLLKLEASPPNEWFLSPELPWSWCLFSATEQWLRHTRTEELLMYYITYNINPCSSTYNLRFQEHRQREGFNSLRLRCPQRHRWSVVSNAAKLRGNWMVRALSSSMN